MEHPLNLAWSLEAGRPGTAKGRHPVLLEPPAGAPLKQERGSQQESEIEWCFVASARGSGSRVTRMGCPRGGTQVHGSAFHCVQSCFERRSVAFALRRAIRGKHRGPSMHPLADKTPDPLE